ncbi:hypothetical protein PRUPE_4G027500 [Prunus persica]|uniref:Uncharacterized protein n=1 Tax=Prunus persica TaxID=3760 RepID=A0A251PGF5_PRUPE|nr:hypothetical protein PRUPE_4G027500 [Prunus persica]
MYMFGIISHVAYELSNEKMKDQLQRNRWCKCYICIFLQKFPLWTCST